MRRFKPVAREMDEFQKEALRLVKEVAEDELDLERVIKNALDFKCEENKENALDEAQYLEERIVRKLRIIDTVIRW